MKRWISILITGGVLALQAFAVGPQIINRDGKISISADNITLGHLLQLWDQATGMKSTAPPELVSRKLSVHFAGLNMTDAVRSIFQGQPFGYGLMQERGIIVTAPASDSTVNQAESVPPEDSTTPEAAQPLPPPQVQRMKPQLAPSQPTVIPTPFGPVISPDGSQPPLVQLPPVPGAPPPPPFFRPEVLPVPPAGATNGPLYNMLFGPIQIHP